MTKKPDELHQSIALLGLKQCHCCTRRKGCTMKHEKTHLPLKKPRIQYKKLGIYTIKIPSWCSKHDLEGAD